MVRAASRHRHVKESGEIVMGSHGYPQCALCNRKDCGNCVYVRRFISAASIEYLPACAECALKL